MWETRLRITSEKAHSHFYMPLEEGKSELLLHTNPRDRPRGRVFAGSTDARSPAFPHNCKIDSMARRTALQSQSPTVSDLSLATRVPFFLSRLLICTLHVPIYSVMYIHINFYKNRLDYGSDCGSFDIQNRCKFVERFFLSEWAWSRVRPLLPRCWSIIFNWRSKAIGFWETSADTDPSNMVALQTSQKLVCLDFDAEKIIYKTLLA